MLTNARSILENDCVLPPVPLLFPLLLAKGLKSGTLIVGHSLCTIHHLLCCIYSVLHPTPPCFGAVMTQFPLWHAWPSGINKVNLMLPYLALDPSLITTCWNICNMVDWVKLGQWPQKCLRLSCGGRVTICFNKSHSQAHRECIPHLCPWLKKLYPLNYGFVEATGLPVHLSDNCT